MNFAPSSAFGITTSLQFVAAGNGRGKRFSEVGKSEEALPGLRQQAEALTALQKLKASNSPRQRAKEKLAMLLRRLQELKALLMNATPEQAKLLANELRSIAGQLASAAQVAGGASAGAGADAAGAASPAATAQAIVESSTADPGSEPGAAQASMSGMSKPAIDELSSDAERKQTPEGRFEDEARTVSGFSARSWSGHSPKESSAPADDTGDDGSSHTLNEARRLLKELIATLRAKLCEGDAAAQEQLISARQVTAERQPLPGMYSRLGSAVDGQGSSPPETAGTGIDVAA